MRSMTLFSSFRNTFTQKWVLTATALLIGTISMSYVFAHGEQLKVGGGVKGPVKLTDVQKKALGLKLEAAGLRPMVELLYLNGEVKPVAGKQAEVSTRISGQITQVYVSLGSSVRAGQRLARVQSRLVGNPPPSVDIVATMSGVIDQMTATVGQSVEPSTTLFHIRDGSEVNIVARVYEEDLGKIVIGQNAHVRLLSYPDKNFTGKIILVGPSLDPLSRTVEVWVKLSNDEGLLKPNLFARVGVILRENKAALTIPNTAIIEANGEKFVFVKQKGAYERVDIIIGASDDKYTEVKDGLVPGDEVVTQGNRQVYTVWLTGGAPLSSEED
ncbi:MAG: efflux RND transporter periplasmic adaptor subunit [Arenimonas sp.]